MSAERPLPPPLVPRAPDCSMCGKEVSYEDGWVCYSCDAYWPGNHDAYDAPGDWTHDDKPRCPSVFRPFETYPQDGRFDDMRWYQYRCILDLGHDKDHRHPGYIGSWTSKQQACNPDDRAIPDPYEVEYFPIIKERRRGFETKPISLAWPFEDGGLKECGHSRECDCPPEGVPDAPYTITVNLPD